MCQAGSARVSQVAAEQVAGTSAARRVVQDGTKRPVNDAEVGAAVRTGGGSVVRQRSQVVHSSHRPSPWPVPGDRGGGGALGGGVSVCKTDLWKAHKRDGAQKCWDGQVSDCCSDTGSAMERRQRLLGEARTWRGDASPVCASFPPCLRQLCPSRHMRAAPNAAETPATCLPGRPPPERLWGGPTALTCHSWHLCGTRCASSSRGARLGSCRVPVAGVAGGRICPGAHCALQHSRPAETGVSPPCRR